MVNKSIGLQSKNRTGALSTLFLAHPQAIGESYFEHQRAALRFALILAGIAAAACLHAIVPGLCQSTARQRIAKLHEELQARSDQHAG